MTERQGGRSRARRAAPYVLAVLVAGCAPETPAPERPAAESRPATPATAPAFLAEADCPSPRVRIQVTEVVKTGPEAVTVKFRFLNPARDVAVPIDGAFGDGPGDPGSLSAIHLLDSAGQKKAFVLRDERGQPLCSTGLGPIPAGGQLDAWARYPVAEGATRVTVQVPGLPPFRDLPVTAPAPGDAPDAR